MITFALFSLAVVLSLGGIVYFSIGWKQAERRAKTAETAYAELLTGSQRREANLLSELNNAKYLAHMAEETKSFHQADAARLAVFVEQYAKDLEQTVVLLKDESPPAELALMRRALRQHNTDLFHKPISNESA